jgi:putative ABC transport system ATP-binding protein
MSTLIELKEISKKYLLGDTYIEALKNVNLTINKGEFAAIVGASGSGKSTLLNLIGTIDNPDSGEILFLGQNIVKLSEDQKAHLRNEKIGFIFQSFNLIPVLTVLENVQIPLLLNTRLTEKERKELAEKNLVDVGLQDYIKSSPNKLSGGQRQRVAIARALVNNPDFILADEPTANLDSKTTMSVIDLMLDLNKRKGVTFLFSTHDEKLMSKVSRIIHIKDGQLF